MEVARMDEGLVLKTSKSVMNRSVGSIPSTSAVNGNGPNGRGARFESE